MPRGHDIVVVGASMGGLDALKKLLVQLPADFPAAVFVVQHSSPNGPGLLSGILDRSANVVVTTASDHDPIEKSRVYVAPPDHHLLVKNNHIRVIRGPHENGVRPAIDPLFRSAAVAHGPHTVGLILTGMLNDGTAGLVAVKRCGGIAIVQQPSDAEFSDMPLTTLAHVDADHCLPLSDIGTVLEQLARQPVTREARAPQDLVYEALMAENFTSEMARDDAIGDLAPFACPACGGSLWEIKTDNVLRYRCHVGHGYSGRALLTAQAGSVEESLLAALRIMEERVKLLAKLSEGEAFGGRLNSASKKSTEIKKHCEVIREMLRTSLEDKVETQTPPARE